MAGDFNINPNFKMVNFENSIQDFNKVFSNSLNETNKAFENNSAEFEKIFNSMSQTQQMQALQADAQYYVGMDSINAQKIENLSPTAKMAQDIGSGFSNSIKQLSSVEKQAEHDFETFASGGDISVHDVMISAQKSNLAMQMAIQLRNQMLNAYNEFKGMQI